MPWWAIIYVTLLALLSCAGVYLNVATKERLSYMLADGASAVCSIVSVVAFWETRLAAMLGWLLFATVLYALIWDCFSLKHDLEVTQDPELSLQENRLADNLTTVLVFSFALPAYCLGFLAAYQQVTSGGTMR